MYLLPRVHFHNSLVGEKKVFKISKPFYFFCVAILVIWLRSSLLNYIDSGLFLPHNSMGNCVLLSKQIDALQGNLVKKNKKNYKSLLFVHVCVCLFECLQSTLNYSSK